MTPTPGTVTVTTTTTRTAEAGPVRWWLLAVGALVTLTLLTMGFAWSVERATRSEAEAALADAGIAVVTVTDVTYRDVVLSGPASAETSAVAAVEKLGLSADVRYEATDASADPQPGDVPSALPSAAESPSPEASEPAAEPSPSPSASPSPEVVELPDLPDLSGVQFETSSATLTAASLPVLDQAADAILAGLEYRPGLKVAIQGHTDAAGDDSANLALSQQRADAVLAYLVGKGVPAATLTATGFGESQPIADNATEEGRALNRRVVLVATEG